jgi:hypothetical protein
MRRQPTSNARKNKSPNLGHDNDRKPRRPIPDFPNRHADRHRLDGWHWAETGDQNWITLIQQIGGIYDGIRATVARRLDAAIRAIRAGAETASNINQGFIQANTALERANRHIKIVTIHYGNKAEAKRLVDRSNKIFNQEPAGSEPIKMD